MKLFSETLERELEDQEAQPFDSHAARKVLETALTEQFRNLADRILATLLLKNVVVGELTWWHYFLTRAVGPLGYCPDFNSKVFAEFRNGLLQDIVRRKIKPLSFSDLGKVEIRILGGSTKLWDDAKINKQLARLGSSYRFTFLGSHALTVNRLIELLKPEIANEQNDPRFIWGEVDHLTATPFGLRFSYINESAISPLLDEAGEGFNFDTTVVIRENLIRIRLEQTQPELLGATEDFERMLELAKAHVTLHELLHAASHNSKLIRPYREAFWADDLKRDVCRFLQTPREPQELNQAFDNKLVSLILDDINKYVDAYKQIRPIPFFKSLLSKMRNQGLITETPDGKIVSSVFDPGKIWVA